MGHIFTYNCLVYIVTLIGPQAKGWNKILGMGNWGRSSDPPPPPPLTPRPPLATGLSWVDALGQPLAKWFLPARKGLGPSPWIQPVMVLRLACLVTSHPYLHYHSYLGQVTACSPQALLYTRKQLCLGKFEEKYFLWQLLFTPPLQARIQGGRGGGVVTPPCSRPPIFFFNKLFNYSKKKKVFSTYK